MRAAVAALLAGCALQGCAQANLLAAIDGPYVPPSQRQAAAAAAAASATVVVPQSAMPETLPAPTLVETDDLPTIEPSRVPPEDLAYPDAQFVGPVLTAPEMAALALAPANAEPAAQPASVDAEILPPVERPMARPEPVATGRPGGSVFSAFHAFALQRMAAPAPRSGRQSMLLADPPSLDPALLTCGNRPPAVLIDLDPEAGLLPLAGDSAADAALYAISAAYLADLRRRGVTIYWISGHGPGSASAIRRWLVDSGLDADGLDPLIVTRFAGESKQVRRQGLGESHCLLAIMGDNRSDFDELYDYVLDASVPAPLEVHIGNGWFLAPPLLSPSPTD